MAEVVYVRVVLFLVAFFVLRPLMFLVIQTPSRAHALGLLGASTLVAFLAGAAILDDPLADTLLAWLVIFAIIAGLWFARWKGQDYERTRRTRDPAEVTEPAETQD
jgi:hypothetical protein